MIIYTNLDARSGLLANPKRWVYAVDGYDVVGMISIEDIPEWYWLNDLFVRGPFRGQGIGSRLIQEAVKLCATDVDESIRCARPVIRHGICCGVMDSNTASQVRFKKAGFEYVCWHGDTARLYSLRFDRSARHA